MDSPSLAILQRVSEVSTPHSNGLDPATLSQIKTHPTVDRAVTAMKLYLFSVAVPGAGTSDFASYAVSEADAPYLAQVYRLELAEGHLPRPRTNDIAISWALAQNRNLQIGDVIGNPDAPAYPGAPSLPAEFVISGIFAAPKNRGEAWLTLMSLEFVQSHSAFANNSMTLLVSARAGQKDAMDDWLEQDLARDGVDVSTHRMAKVHLREVTRDLILTMALLESVLAIVAAITLVVLNYIFITQRQSELGVLNALGLGRLQLIWRVLRETTLTTGVAWIASIVLCAICLVYQSVTFTAKGLHYNWTNPVPWLFTLPIPITVLLATSGTVAWTLSKLDPVAIIERR
jgi:ABC-type lipoprotein release transport system permease subunit